MKLLLYCTKAKPYLYKTQLHHKYLCFDHKQDNKLNGKIVAECDFEVEDLRIVDDDPLGAYWYETKTLSENEVLEKSCLTGDELFDYLGEDNEGYAIHIKNLHIFDKPRELSDYYKYINKPIINAPQNMMKAFSIKEYSRRYVENGYVYEVRGDDITDYVLISIQPQWLCKILNGDKTIEVRKKVLKEMLV